MRCEALDVLKDLPKSPLKNPSRRDPLKCEVPTCSKEGVVKTSSSDPLRSEDARGAVDRIKKKAKK
jgi:hypothetical protein